MISLYTGHTGCASRSHSVILSGRKVTPTVVRRGVLSGGQQCHGGHRRRATNPPPRSILHLKRRTLLGPVLPAVIEPGRGNVRMSEPLLHLWQCPHYRQVHWWRLWCVRHARRSCAHPRGSQPLRRSASQSPGRPNPDAAARPKFWSYCSSRDGKARRPMTLHVPPPRVTVRAPQSPAASPWPPGAGATPVLGADGRARPDPGDPGDPM